MTCIIAPLAGRAQTAEAAAPRAGPGTSAEGPATLRSPVLSLVVHPVPYRFEVVERATGTVLLRHRATGVRERTGILNGLRWARSARDIRFDGTQLSATLEFGEDRPNSLGVGFQFAAPEVLAVTLRGPRVEARARHDSFSIAESFADQGEHIYGLLEVAWPRKARGGALAFDRGLDNRGVEADLAGNRMHRWLDGMRYSSARAPFYMTSGGYGIYVRSAGKARYALAVDGHTRFEFDDTELAYFVIYGPSCAEILHRYNDLAGPSRMPPDWALGPIWWRDDPHEDLRDAEGGHHRHAQDVVLGDVRALQRHRLPASAMWLDRPYARSDRDFGWGGVDRGCLAFDAGFPDPRGMIAAVKAAGLRLMLWIANRSDNELGQEGKPLGYLLDTGRAVDMRNPDAYRWFQAKLDCFLRQGVQGYKIDRGEEGEVPEHLENVNATLFPRMAAEGLARRWGDDHFVFARNLYDTGRRHAAVWNGDAYGWKGLRESVRQALRCALMNFPMWGSDTGGYGDTTPELFARWSQFAAYTPMMEVLIGPGRTPWLDFPPDIFAIVAEQARTKHDLIPYLRSLLFAATRTGMPVLRPLVLAYPGDDAVRDLSDQYLYGPDLLVAPVLEEGARERAVYLPAGWWLDYHDRTTLHAGRRTVHAAAPLSHIPLFVREGAIIARGDVLKANNTWTRDWAPRLRVEIFPSARVASTFRYDAGRGPRTVASRPTPDGFRVDLEDLGVAADLAVYCHRPREVVAGGRRQYAGRDYVYDRVRQVLEMPLRGPARVEVRGEGHGSLSLFRSSVRPPSRP
jgi:alpha-glucosidase (family GH31 glycosyl hydrolase)